MVSLWFLVETRLNYKPRISAGLTDAAGSQGWACLSCWPELTPCSRTNSAPGPEKAAPLESFSGVNPFSFIAGNPRGSLNVATPAAATELSWELGPSSFHLHLHQMLPCIF